MKKKHATHEPEFSHGLTTIHLWSVSALLGHRPGGLEHLWADEVHPGQVASSSLIYKYELASLCFFLTSNTGVFFMYQFIPSCPDSITAARGTYVWPSWVWSDSGKVAQGLLASDQTESVLPSDCPHVACQGSYLQKKGSVHIKGRLPASNPAVIRFPANLARGNICPLHWTDSSISSRPY